MRTTLIRGLVLTTTLVSVLSACSGSDEDSAETERTIPITSVDDQTGSEFYTIGSGAFATADEFGTTVTVQINITNANQIVINPVATIEFTDGTTVRCEEDDLRRLPSLLESTTEAEIPCQGSFPDDTDVASMTVVDDYK